MKIEKVGVVFATRELFVVGRDQKITVKIGKPVPFPDGSNYYCPYQIVGLGKEKIHFGAGIDAVQALLLALHNIGAELYTSKEARARTLGWEGGGIGDLGFPVTDAIADLAPKKG